MLLLSKQGRVLGWPGTGQGGSITGLSWRDLQREAQEGLTQAADPS